MNRPEYSRYFVPGYIWSLVPLTLIIYYDPNVYGSLKPVQGVNSFFKGVI
ncbi:hypothetical protein [Mucilaginibacter sp.]